MHGQIPGRQVTVAPVMATVVPAMATLVVGAMVILVGVMAILVGVTAEGVMGMGSPVMRLTVGVVTER